MKRFFATTLAIGLAAATLKAQFTPRPAHPRPELETNRATVDPDIPSYKRMAAELSGSIKGVQSDTTPGVVKLWIEGFQKIYPKVQIDAVIAGSAAAGPALTNGTGDFGLIAREIMIKEETPFEKKFGYKPLGIAVAGGSYRARAFTDALTFFVNKDNPLEKLSFGQIDAMYSKTRYRGEKEITTWGQLGLTGEWADKPIHLWSVRAENGFEHFLQIRVLRNGQWKEGINMRDTVIPLASMVAADKYAIGYAGFSYLAEGAKPLAIAEKDGGPYSKGTFDEVASQRYPLSRVILIYVHKVPGKPLDPKLAEFVRYILSREGQQAAVEDGIFTPLPAEFAKRELAKLK